MKVICAVDGSQFSRWSTEAVATLAAQPPKTLVLLHVLDTGRLKATGKRERINLTRSLSALQREGTQLLHRLAQAARAALGQRSTAPSTKIETVLAQGQPAEIIVRQSARRRADLVIVGSRGLSDGGEFLLGSVSRKVVAGAACPVVVVKRQLRGAARAVLAIDGSRQSRTAAEFFRKHLLEARTRLTVVTVVAPVATDLAARVLTKEEIEQLQRPSRLEAERLLATWRETFLKDGCAVSTELLEGRPGDTLTTYLDHTHPDLVIVGSRRLTGVERFQLGSVSESIVKYAPCSVMVVKGRTV